MRRWRNQPHAGYRMPQTGDDAVHLVAGKLAALARLRALCHLDLQLIGIDQIVRGDAKPCRGHLFDRAATPITIHILLVAIFVLAAFAGIRLASDPVHRNRQRLVRFLADRSEGHRAGAEPLDDLLGRLDFFERDGIALLELKQPPDGAAMLRFVVHKPAVLLESRIAGDADGLLELGDGIGVPHVVFAVATPLVESAVLEHFTVHSDWREAVTMPQQALARDHFHTDAIEAGCGAGEILFHKGFA